MHFPFDLLMQLYYYYHSVIVDIHAFQVQYRVSKWLERQILSTGQWLLRSLLCSWWCHILSVRRIVLLLFRIVPTHNALHLHDDNCCICVSSCTLYSLHIQIYIKYVGLVRLLSSREPCRHRERFEIIICNLFLSEEIRDSFGHCVDFILSSHYSHTFK